MEKSIEEVKDIFERQKDGLPLVLQGVDFQKKNLSISGKIIVVSIYRTRFYPIGRYYKHLIRL